MQCTIFVNINLFVLLESALVITQCLGSTTSNRFICGLCYIQCIYRQGELAINEHVAS